MKRKNIEPPVQVKLTNLWTERVKIFGSQKDASRFLGRDPNYIHHVLHSGELARDSAGNAYYVEVLR